MSLSFPSPSDEVTEWDEFQAIMENSRLRAAKEPRAEEGPPHLPVSHLATVLHERLRLMMEFEELDKKFPGQFQEPLSFTELLEVHIKGLKGHIQEYVVLPKRRDILPMKPVVEAA